MTPKVIIYDDKNNYSNKICALNNVAYQMINSSVVFFDVRNLRIRLPSFDDNKTHNISHPNQEIKYKDKTYQYPPNWATFSFKNTTGEDIAGEYELEKEGDWFILFKKD